MNSALHAIVKYQKKASERKADGVFVVEGIRMFTEIPKERLRTAVFSASFSKAYPELVGQIKAISSVLSLTVKDEDFERISDTKTPQGILAVCAAENRTEDEVLSAGDGVYMLLENLQDPGNLGTVFRSAEAAGIAGILMDEACCDVYNPKVIRSTMGSFLRMPFAVVPDLKETVRKIQKAGGTVYAAHLKGSVPYDEPDYRGLSAFIIGNEAAGISDELTKEAKKAVRIPMEGRVESLNAAMAATILMYEARRQRNTKKTDGKSVHGGNI